MKQRRQRLFQISEITNGLIDPILARRAGINTTLLGSWDEIAGPDFADCTRPEKIAWSRRVSEMDDDEGFVPGTLTIACEGARALFLAHAQDQLIQRVNGFFGYPAIARIRIVQKPVSDQQVRRRKAPRLAENQARRLDTMLTEIEDPKLKAALERLGAGVIAGRARK
ncbi:DUF721 domain-containing protein [Pararhizobium haloflavum]|uniref:DUF721 domain-containing protein n=1 Tax=Pararhizobium haloflavum TaxID=2037914 RepID=UPI000C18675D|nr:DciA family protein [Pararhizobium haloflavum]